ncbi:hypothetical protein BC936DRAFT_144559, partial [Jimgerdemannia flammicorona]
LPLSTHIPFTDVTNITQSIEETKTRIRVPIFNLNSQPYSTRTSTIILVDRRGTVTFVERDWFDTEAMRELEEEERRTLGEVRWSFTIGEEGLKMVQKTVELSFDMHNLLQRNTKGILQLNAVLPDLSSKSHPQYEHSDSTFEFGNTDIFNVHVDLWLTMACGYKCTSNHGYRSKNSDVIISLYNVADALTISPIMMDPLPSELLTAILAYLPFQDHLAIQLVNKTFHLVSRHHPNYANHHATPDAFERKIPAFLNGFFSLLPGETVRLLVTIGDRVRTELSGYHSQIRWTATMRTDQSLLLTIRFRSYAVMPAGVTSLASVIPPETRTVAPPATRLEYSVVDTPKGSDPMTGIESAYHSKDARLAREGAGVGAGADVLGDVSAMGAAVDGRDARVRWEEDAVLAVFDGVGGRGEEVLEIGLW